MDRTNNHFYGRERILSEIVSGALAAQPTSFSLVGSKLVGKSKLLDYLASESGPFLSDEYESLRPHPYDDAGRIIVVQIDCNWRDAQQDLLGHIRDRMLHQVRTQERIELDWQAIEAESMPSRQVWSMSRQLHQMEYRLILCIDNFDTVFKIQLITADAADELRPLTLELALVVATEQPLHDLDRELATSPLFNVMTQLFIGLIEPEAASRWIRSYVAAYPAIQNMSDELLRLTGGHPFLLKQIGDILAEVQLMLGPGQELDSSHLPLIRLRLAEHGRQLFVTLWRKLQNPPRRIDAHTTMGLLDRLVSAPLKPDQIAPERFPLLNWLINQAIVIYSPEGYRLFSSLFAEYLAHRLPSAHIAPMRTGNHAPSTDDQPIYDRLTKTESALLRYFQTHSHTVIPPEQLLADVWKRPNASPRRVQEAIRRLRLRLDDAAPTVGVIENERGRGYRFIPTA